MKRWNRLYWVAMVFVVIYEFGRIKALAGEVTYDGRSLIINGERKILFSGSIHYPRSTPEMWPSLIAKAKEGGVDVIQTYVFWNLHEPERPGHYDFSGRYDLVRFIKEVKSQGLYACLRTGPFIESEWTYGGFPFWLHDVPGIVFRSNNVPFKFYMQNFTTKIVNLMKSESLFASQGGPIILSQIENEYQNVEAAFREDGPLYVKWAAEMAVGLQTGVPWVMCKQLDAPDPVINSCNGMRCGETFTGPNKPNKPAIWTENWTSFLQRYGDSTYLRSAEDITFHVTLFIAKMNGSYINYYMYHGGTNLGRTGAAYIVTSYYDQAPLDEYGLLRQPKWGHLKELHAAIKSCSVPLLQGERNILSLGQFQQAYTFQGEKKGCVAFLLNNDATKQVTVQFQNSSYELLPKSISILQDCAKVIFNTATVRTRNNRRVVTPTQIFNSTHEWEEFKDFIPKFTDTSKIRSKTFLEHMNMTKDKTDYLWYTLGFVYNTRCVNPVLQVETAAHVAHTFLNDKYMGMAHANHSVKAFNFKLPVSLKEGLNYISMLSVMVGLPDSGAFLERKYAGLTKAEIQCSEAENYDFTTSTWGYQVGLRGETLKAYDVQKNSARGLRWNPIREPNQPLTWYKIDFEVPAGDQPIALDLSSMGKGEAWVNGQSIGRYWSTILDSKGIPSQTMYHVPRAFLQDSGNVLVLLEEAGGNPLNVSLNTISVSNSNVHNYDNHNYPMIN